MMDGKQIKPATVGALQVTSAIQLVSNLTTDGTLATNSNTKYPSEAAVRTYVAAHGGGTSMGCVWAIANRLYPFY